MIVLECPRWPQGHVSIRFKIFQKLRIHCSNVTKLMTQLNLSCRCSYVRVSSWKALFRTFYELVFSIFLKQVAEMLIDFAIAGHEVRDGSEGDKLHAAWLE
jgi:hypothetical protein